MITTRATVANYIRAVGLRDVAALETIYQRAPVSAATTGDADYSPLVGADGGREFRTALERAMLPTALENTWRVPFFLKVAIDADAAVGYWVESGAPIPASAFAAGEVQLAQRTVGALVIVSKEMIEATGTDGAIVRIFRRALAKAVGTAFLSDAAAADGTPAGIGSGVTPLPSTGNDATDLAAMVEAADALDLDLREASWILSPGRAAGIALSLGLRDLGLRGGTLLGAPAVTDPAAGDRVYLVAADRMGVAVGAPDIESTENAAIQMDDSPTNNSVTPTATNLVSVFQADAIAYRATLPVNWAAAEDSVVILAGADES